MNDHRAAYAKLPAPQDDPVLKRLVQVRSQLDEVITLLEEQRAGRAEQDPYHGQR